MDLQRDGETTPGGPGSRWPLPRASSWPAPGSLAHRCHSRWTGDRPNREEQGKSKSLSIQIYFLRKFGVWICVTDYSFFSLRQNESYLRGFYLFGGEGKNGCWIKKSTPQSTAIRHETPKKKKKHPKKTTKLRNTQKKHVKV